MSDLAQAALIGGGIFVVVMLSQLGRRQHSLKGLVRPLVTVAAFGFFYLRDAPTATHGEWSLYAIGVALGLVFGAIAVATTRMELDTSTGKVMTTCGAGFVATWLVALAARLVFIWSATNVPAVHDRVGELMLSHQVEVSALPPFFVLWALTMVVSRVAVVQVRAHRLAAGAVATTPVARPVAA
jgi:membrane protein CcdC involved in cytochrome C biogenesis